MPEPNPSCDAEPNQGSESRPDAHSDVAQEVGSCAGRHGSPENAVEFHTQITASWGHCDAAQIVYYPNYFDWFDQCFQGLLGSVGYDQRRLREEFGIIGTGAVNATGQFLSPVTYGDVLESTSYIEAWSDRSFTVYHRFDNRGKLAVEGREVRLWLLRTGDGETAIEAGAIHEDFKTSFGHTR